MRIVLTSSEVVPFSKTGGLGDVAASLPKALTATGHDVFVIAPFYPRQYAKLPVISAPTLTPVDLSFNVPVGQHEVAARVLRSQLPGSATTVYLIDQPQYFDRAGLYLDRDGDFRDNCERFVFFCRAALQLIELLDLRPDVIHANDWQTGLIPALLEVEGSSRPGLAQAASLFTIHNQAFQGQFWHWDMLLTGLDWKYFNWRQMEFFGNLNLLKTGIMFADMITTVSPTYAREIQTPEYGCGLNGVLSSRREDLVGILNGVDTEDWNPATDFRIPLPYNFQTVDEGKQAAKAALQKKMNLPLKPQTPLIGVVSRLAGQKGFDIILGSLAEILALDVQFVCLGTGDAGYEAALKKWSHDVPEKLACYIGYDEDLAHLIEAGADIFLMPSQYEPCGLNQMYSLMYGTVPVVRAVGGLADSVIDASESNLANATANGFTFHEYRSDVLFRQICRALGLFLDRRTWKQLQRSGMDRDWSWERSAKEYTAVYQRAVQKHRHPW